MPFQYSRLSDPWDRFGSSSSPNGRAASIDPTADPCPRKENPSPPLRDRPANAVSLHHSPTDCFALIVVQRPGAGRAAQRMPLGEIPRIRSYYVMVLRPHSLLCFLVPSFAGIGQGVLNRVDALVELRFLWVARIDEKFWERIHEHNQRARHRHKRNDKDPAQYCCHSGNHLDVISACLWHVTEVAFALKVSGVTNSGSILGRAVVVHGMASEWTLLGGKALAARAC
jgi:hypothetical protein